MSPAGGALATAARRLAGTGVARSLVFIRAAGGHPLPAALRGPNAEGVT